MAPFLMNNGSYQNVKLVSSFYHIEKGYFVHELSNGCQFWNNSNLKMLVCDENKKIKTSKNYPKRIY